MNKQVNEHWVSLIKQTAEVYSSLKYLCADEYWPGRRHQLIRQVNGPRDVPRVIIHFGSKLATGAYILQRNRASFYQALVDPTCMLCRQDSETVEHFLMDCSALEHVRHHILEDLKRLGTELLPSRQDSDNLVQLILDPSRLLSAKKGVMSASQIDLHRQARRIHLERYQKLAIIPSRKSKTSKGKMGRSTQ